MPGGATSNRAGIEQESNLPAPIDGLKPGTKAPKSFKNGQTAHPLAKVGPKQMKKAYRTAANGASRLFFLNKKAPGKV